MGSLYRNDLNKYKKYFKEVAGLLGVSVEYQYIIKRNTEKQSGESIYSELSKPISLDVAVEQGNPKVESLKQLGWFTDESNLDDLLVDFPFDTPNLQEGCRIKFTVKNNKEQYRTYIVTKLSNELLYPTCIKCLCHPVLDNESTYDKGEISYGQQDITSDDENYTFINEKAKIKYF